MTKPIIYYLMLLVGGAFAAGAGVLTYTEWQEARQVAEGAAPAEPAEGEVAAGEGPPASEPPAHGKPAPAPEESVATPQPLPPAPASPAPPSPAAPEREVAALPPAEAESESEQPAEAQSAPEPEQEQTAEAPRTVGGRAVPEEPIHLAEPRQPATAGADPAPAEAPAAAESPAAADAEAPAVAEAPAAAEEPAAAEPLAPPQQPTDRAMLRPGEPPAPAEPDEAAPAGPAFDIVRVEPTGEAVIAGNAPRRSKVQVLSNGEVVAETKADDSGNWVALPERPLRPGSHDLTIRALGEAGEQTDSDQHVAVAVPDEPDEEVVAVLDTPGEPSAILAAPGREAPRAAAEPPQKLEPMATASEVAEGRPAVLSVDAVEAEGRTMYVAGAGDPGALVRVYVDGELVGEAQAGAGGRWLVEATRALEEGRVTVRADQLTAGTAQVEARAEVPFMRRLDMAALVPAAQAGAGAGESAEGGDLPEPGAVIIRRGDNLWTISRRTYGRGVRYTTIYKANEDQIRDPHWIYPGQVFVLPTGDRAWDGD